MGTWATGLYGGDFAVDLRSTVAAVSDISIANYLRTIPAGRVRPLAMPGEPSMGRARAITGIAQLLSD